MGARAMAATGGVGGGGGRRGFRASPTEAVGRQQGLNRFLMSYFNAPRQTASRAGADQAEEKPFMRRKRYWEKLCNFAPDMRWQAEQSVLLEDTSGRFKRLLLAGRAVDMVLLNLMTYSLFDLLYVNTFVAIFATYAIDVVVRMLRSEIAVRNIASKTLLDDRFLL